MKVICCRCLRRLPCQKSMSRLLAADPSATGSMPPTELVEIGCGHLLASTGILSTNSRRALIDLKTGAATQHRANTEQTPSKHRAQTEQRGREGGGGEGKDPRRGNNHDWDPPPAPWCSLALLGAPWRSFDRFDSPTDCLLCLLINVDEALPQQISRFTPKNNDRFP